MNVSRSSPQMLGQQQSDYSQAKFRKFNTYKNELTSIFTEKVAPIYGDQTFNLQKFEEGSSRRCEAMKIEGNIVGVISYMNRLQKVKDGSSGFEVRNLFLSDDKYFDDEHRDLLLQRAMKLAHERKTNSIYFRIASADHSLVKFLQDRSFVEIERDTISKDKKEAIVFSRTIDLVKKENTEKRKRDQEEDSLALEGNVKKVCFDEMDRNIYNRKFTYSIDFDQIEKTRRSPPPVQNPSIQKSRKLELTLKKIYIHQIRDGQKTVEGRIWNTVKDYKVGDTIRFFYFAYPNDDVVCKIVKIERFNSFPEMLKSCGFQRCLPEVKSLAEAERVYNKIPNYPERAAKNGVGALHLEVLP